MTVFGGRATPHFSSLSAGAQARPVAEIWFAVVIWSDQTEVNNEDDGMCTLHLFTPIHQEANKICADAPDQGSSGIDGSTRYGCREWEC